MAPFNPPFVSGFNVSTKHPLTSRKTNNRIPVPLLPPYPLNDWILKPCKQIITCYFLFFNDVPFRLQARTCISSKRAAYTGLTPTWGTSSLSFMTVYYLNASHLRRSLVPRGVLEAFRPTFGDCHKVFSMNEPGRITFICNPALSPPIFLPQ